MLRDVQVLRAHPEHDGRAVDPGQRRPRQWKVEVAEPHAAISMRELEQVHAGRAEESRDEPVRGPVVHLPRRGALLQHAAIEHGDAVAHRHGLDLVVRDVDRGDAQTPLQPGDLRPRLDPQLGIEIGQRLVEQEHAGLPHQRTSHRHPLPLPTRERLGLAIEEALDLEQPGRRAYPLRGLVLRRTSDVERERHVLGDRHVRVQRVVLEHHRDVALLRWEVGDVPVPDQEPAVVGALQTGEESQRRRLAAAGRPDDDEELAVVDHEIEPVERRTDVAREAASDLLVRDRRHGATFPSPAGTCRTIRVTGCAQRSLLTN